VQALGNFPVRRAAAALIPYLNDHSLLVRKRTEEALIKIKDIKSLVHFIKTFNPKDPLIQQEAALILEEIGWLPADNRELAFYLFIRPEWDSPIEWNQLPVKDKDAVEILIDKLIENDLDTQGRATKALGGIGDARALEPLLKVLYRKNFFVRWHKETEQTFRKICKRFIHEGSDLICRKCFLRYRKYARYFAVFQLPTYAYYVCPNCHCDSNFFKAKKIVLLLDQHFAEKFHIDNTIIYINWLKTKEICDYDEIIIEDANEYEVEKLVLKLRNDMNDERKGKLPEIPVYLSPQLKLSPGKMNLLKDNFHVQIKKKLNLC
jgi:hypothetical protein